MIVLFYVGVGGRNLFIFFVLFNVKMEGYMTEFSDEFVKLPRKVMADNCCRKLSDLRTKLMLLNFETSNEKKPEKSEILNSIAEVKKYWDKILTDPTNVDVIKLNELKIVARRILEKLKKKFPKLGDHCSELVKILIRLDFLDQENEDIFVEFNYLCYKLKKLSEREITEDDEQDFKKMSEMFIKYLPKLEDPYSEIDHILYKNGTLQVDEPEEEYLIDPEKLLCNIDLHDFTHAYLHMVKYKNIVNQYIDNAFLKLVEIKGKTPHWHIDFVMQQFLESKVINQICIGLKIFKTCLKVDGFQYGAEMDSCSAASDLYKISDLYRFRDSDENEMARFVAKHAKDCHDSIKKKGELLVYTAKDIFVEILQGDKIRQYQVRALYEIIKSDGNFRNVLGYLYGKGLHRIKSVVYRLLYYIRSFNKKYEELDEEMREIDEQIGQEFGGFSLEIVDDDDTKKKKPLCASESLEDSTLNKYLFYDDAMKTLSMVSFLYKYFEKYEKDFLKYFKIGIIFSHVTEFVITVIRQRDLNQKIDKSIWIMEKILNTCPFIVFGHDEKEEHDIFMKLMYGEEIDEVELKCLKDFMTKNGLSYEDKCLD